jgi:hypothetical protein
MSGNQLQWYYESPGRWTAQCEKMIADDCCVFYRITVGKMGLFSLAESDRILEAGSKLFETFHAAQKAAAVLERKVSRER